MIVAEKRRLAKYLLTGRRLLAGVAARKDFAPVHSSGDPQADALQGDLPKNRPFLSECIRAIFYGVLTFHILENGIL